MAPERHPDGGAAPRSSAPLVGLPWRGASRAPGPPAWGRDGARALGAPLRDQLQRGADCRRARPGAERRAVRVQHHSASGRLHRLRRVGGAHAVVIRRRRRRASAQRRRLLDRLADAHLQQCADRAQRRAASRARRRCADRLGAGPRRGEPSSWAGSRRVSCAPRFGSSAIAGRRRFRASRRRRR